MNLPHFLRLALVLLALPMTATAQPDPSNETLPPHSGHVEIIRTTDAPHGSLQPQVVVGVDGRVSVRLPDPTAEPASAAGRLTEEWDDRFGGALALGSGSVDAIAVDGSRIYVGGTFSEIGGISANNVAMFDRATGAWSPLGTGTSNGITGSYCFVTDIEVSGNDVYVGGFFTRAGGSSVHNVARWDGASWHPVGSGMNTGSYARALEMHQGELIAGGTFTIVDQAGDTIKGLARWNGSQWSDVGPGLRNGPYPNDVMSLLSRGTELFVGGLFLHANDSTVGGLLQWNGERWRSLSDTLGFVPIVTELADAPNGDLYVGGAFGRDYRSSDRPSFNNIARWDGTQWHRLGEGMRRPFGVSAPLGALVIAPDGVVYAGGDLVDSAGRLAVNSVARWDGTEWHTMEQGLYYGIEAMAVIDGGVLAGGSFTRAGSVDAHGLALWNGSAWRKWEGEISQAGGDVYCSAVDSEGRLYVAGKFSMAGGMPVNNVARWDGTAWSALGTGVGSTINSISIGPDGDIYVAGGFGFIGRAGEAATFNMARWDGQQWHPVGDSTNGGQVFAMAHTAAGFVSGGSFRFGEEQHGVARWDGSRWQPLGEGLRGLVNALLVRGNDLYAGGGFSGYGDLPLYNIARWDGTSWSPLGDVVPTGGAVRALAANGDDLFVGGNFSRISSLQAANIARWNIASSTWSPLGEGMNSDVYALSAIGGNLFAGGSFRTAGGEPASYIARWDGSTWSPLGSGLNSTVWTLAIANRVLYAGGAFDSAGGKHSPALAMWNGAVSAVPQAFEPSAIRLDNWPNPASTDATTFLETPGRERVTIDLLSPLGEPVVSIFDGIVEAGEHQFRWSTHGIATGAYLLRARAGARQEIRVVNVVR